jgi:predicted phage-related endonuclease
MSRRVVIKASDVAAVLGLNPYKPVTEIRDEIWKKYFPETFSGKTKTDEAHEALAKSQEAQKALDTALNVHAKDSTEAQANFETARAKIMADASLGTEDRQKIIEHVRSRCYTTHGTRSEDRTAQKVESDEGSVLVRDNCTYSLMVATHGAHDFVVSGRIDRLEISPEGAKTLVEIKNRTRGLFKCVRDYENVQIQVYLHMLGLVRAKLIEQYNQKTNTIEIVRDEELWDNVIWPGLLKFSRNLHNDAASPEHRNEPNASDAEQAEAS